MHTLVILQMNHGRWPIVERQTTLVGLKVSFCVSPIYFPPLAYSRKIERCVYNDTKEEQKTCEMIFTGVKAGAADHYSVFDATLTQIYLRKRVNTIIARLVFQDACGPRPLLKIYYIIDNAPYHVGQSDESRRIFTDHDGQPKNRMAIVKYLMKLGCTTLSCKVQVGEVIERVDTDLKKPLLTFSCYGLWCFG